MQTQLISLSPGIYYLTARRSMTLWVGTSLLYLPANVPLPISSDRFTAMSYEGWPGEITIVEQSNLARNPGFIVDQLGGPNRQFDDKFQGQKADFIVVDDEFLRGDQWSKSLVEELRSCQRFYNAPRRNRRVLLCG